MVLNDPCRLLCDLNKAVNRAKVPFYLCGSFASGIYGQYRTTNDLDIVVAVSQTNIGGALQAFHTTFRVDDQDAHCCLEDLGVWRRFTIFHEATSFKVDVFVPQPTENNLKAFSRVRLITVEGVGQVPFSSAEDVVISKLRWYELGNRVSEKQYNDIVQILEIQGEKLDRVLLDRLADHYQVAELLAEARSEVIEA